MSETVRYEVDERVATITLSRPEAMNGLDVATKEALLEAVQRAAQDDAVRCVVVRGQRTGVGRAFTSTRTHRSARMAPVSGHRGRHDARRRSVAVRAASEAGA